MKEEFEYQFQREARILKCYPHVLFYLRKFNIEEDLLQEAIKDTFVEAFLNMSKLKDPNKTKDWMFKIAKKAGLEHVRKSKNITIKECPFNNFVVKSRRRAKLLCNAEIISLIKNVENENLYIYISRLAENEEKVLLLYFLYGHSLKEVAVIIGESLDDTKSILRKASHKLREMLEKGDSCNERTEL